MKKLALALVCFVSVAFFASCTEPVANPEPSIAVMTGDNYIYDGQTIDLYQEYNLGFRVASNSQTLKELASFSLVTKLKEGKAKARFEIGAPAKTATFELYDITGLCVFKKKMSDLNAGRNQFENLDLKSLGSDVYTARLKVEFEGGSTKQKVFRVGVVR